MANSGRFTPEGCLSWHFHPYKGENKTKFTLNQEIGCEYWTTFTLNQEIGGEYLTTFTLNQEIGCEDLTTFTLEEQFEVRNDHFESS